MTNCRQPGKVAGNLLFGEGGLVMAAIFGQRFPHHMPTELAQSDQLDSCNPEHRFCQALVADFM